MNKKNYSSWNMLGLLFTDAVCVILYTTLV